MSAGAKADRARLSPLAFALNRLFPKRGRAPYATLERLVVLAVVRAMSLDDGTGDWNCFLSYPTIARWSGVSPASVKRMLRRHCDGPAPLFYRSQAGETRGRPHSCYRFTLVWHPEHFAAARDARRGQRSQMVDRALRDLQAERVALQRQHEAFGGPLSETEYRRKLAALERPVRNRKGLFGPEHATREGAAWKVSHR